MKANANKNKKSVIRKIKETTRAKSGRRISARKMIEEALLRQNELYRLLADNSSDGVTLIGTNGTIEYMSPSHLKIFGYEEGEVLGMNVQWIIEQVHPDDRERVIAIQQEDQKNHREHSEYKIRVRRKDGSYIWVEDFVRRVYDAQGQVLRVIVNSRNITQRRLTEQALQMAENRYRDLFENAVNGIFISTPEGTFLDVNHAMAHIYGYTSPEEMIQSISDIPSQIYVLSEDRWEFVRLMTEEGRVENFEAQNYRKDGSIIWIRTNARVVQREGGTVYYEGFLTDITERKKIEEALRQSEALKDTVINSMNANIAVIDPQGKIISVNRPWENFAFANGILELEGTVKNVNYLDVLKKAIAANVQDSPFVLNGVLSVLSGEISKFTSEYSFHSPNGTRWYLMNVLPLTLVSGGAVISHEDITPRKNVEEKIRRQVEFLTALKEIHSVILSTPDLQSSLRILVSQTRSLLGLDVAAILLAEPEHKTLIFGDGLGFRTQNFETSRVRFGDSYAGKAAVERRMISIPDLNLVPDNPFKIGPLQGEDFVSYHGYPLIVKGEVIGVLEAFHRSPVWRDELWHDFFETLASQAAIAIENARLFEGLKHSNEELELAYDSTIEGWSHALDLRDHETEGHTLRVTVQTLELARRLGIPEEDLPHIRYGALLHDIGKMGVPDTILLKPGPLTDEEWAVMRKHPVFAYELLQPIRYLRKAALEIPFCHHERWDGSGYPRGLKGEEIPFAARMFAVVDVWDALTNNRPYREAWNEEKALSYLREHAGLLFDLRVVNTFIELLKQTPAPR